jgi:alkanesulfonate monooxygenase SsuD/methylene tetrahydromethanopterin reductase-like flavin-dependent oxidoreductase (luciferase family)
MGDPSLLHLAVALDGAGWHPAAWRAERARPADLFDAHYWSDQIVEAESGLLDLVTIDDTMAVQSVRRGVPDDRLDQVRGRLDAVLVAARVAPVTSRIGIVPVATTTHTEPFHLSKAIATLDWVSNGRAGVQVRVSGMSIEARQFGRRVITDPVGAGGTGAPSHGEAAASHEELFDEAADAVEVFRRLWDSWEDDAEIRDATTGRFVDRERLHYIDFEGRWFSVKGPSITPRPPQGQPVVACLAHVTAPYRLAANSADVVFVTPKDRPGLIAIEAELRALEEQVGRSGDPLRILADVVVFLDDRPGAAASRKAALDELDGHELRSDALVFTGTTAELADLLESWSVPGISGFRLRPGTVPVDLEGITRRLVPELQRRGRFRQSYAETMLRTRLGLEIPANRYTTR